MNHVSRLVDRTPKLMLSLSRSRVGRKVLLFYALKSFVHSIGCVLEMKTSFHNKCVTKRSRECQEKDSARIMGGI